MKIKFLKYSRAVRTESGDSRVEAQAAISGDENPDLAFEDLKKFVEEKLGIKSAAQEFKNNPFAALTNQK